MRKYKLAFLIVFLLMAVSMFIITPSKQALVVEASSATTNTYTLDYRKNFVTTQDAYLPQETYTELGLSSPNDMIISDTGNVYLSDTGNKRVLVIDSANGKIIEEIKSIVVDGVDTKLKRPMGVFINDNEEKIYNTASKLLYICDSDAARIYILNENLECIRVVEKPTSVLFSNRDFHPQKISVDPGGSMYVLGEGINEGVMQLSIEGEFLGYFATNKVNLSLIERLQSLLYTQEQLDKLPSKNPPVFSNLYTDKRGLVYTTTTSTIDYAVVQKHNTAGQNQFTKYMLVGERDFVDIYTDASGLVYATSQSGYIYVYTQQGEFIHCFGGGGGISTPDIAGVFKRVSSIAVDGNRNIWILDGEKEIIQTFVPTDYSKTIYAAIDAYLVSDYERSIALWNGVLDLNQMSSLAHNNIGLNYLYSQNYDLAMEHLKIADNKVDYSKAFWEVRNNWVQDNLTWMIFTALGLVCVYFAVMQIDKRKPILDPVRGVKKKVTSVPIIKEVSAMFSIARHPEIGFYDLKKGNKGSLRGAIIILLIMFATYLVYLTGKGFIYQYVDVVFIDFVSVIGGFFAIIFCFAICNYLVTSITDGNGTFKDIFKLLMYSLAPVIIGLISIVILSHIMTQQEAFFLDVIFYGCALWSVILVGLGMVEIQGYNLKKLLISILLTVVLLLILILVLLIIFVLSQQLFDFIKLFFQEVLRNVKG